MRMPGPVFDRLLGYSTVLLAVPLAGMDFKGLPVKKLGVVVVMASLVGALLPMALAYVLMLNMETILAFATRSVTTPVGLSVAQIIDAPLVMANLIIIVSGILGAAFVVCYFATFKMKGRKAWLWVWWRMPSARWRLGRSVRLQGAMLPLA